MKQCLCVLIAATFAGSSFVLFEIGGISFYLFRILFLIFTAAHLFFYTRQNDMQKKVSRIYTGLLTVLCFYLPITLILTPSYSAWINGAIVIAINVLLIYYVVYYTETEQDLSRYIKVFVFGLLINLLIAVYEYQTGNHVVSSNYLSPYAEGTWEYETLSAAPTAFLFNPNNLGVAAVLGIPFAKAAFGEGRTLFSKGACVLLRLLYMVLCLYIAFATGSRGAILLSVGCFFVTIFAQQKTFIRRFFSILGVLLFVVILYNGFSDFILKQLNYAHLGEGQSIISTADSGRFEIYQRGWQLAKDSWFLGTGPLTAEAALLQRFGSSRFIHLFWLETLITLGAVGLVCVVIFYARCLFVSFAARNTCRALSGAVTVALLFFSIACIIPPTIFTQHFIWLLFGFAVALEKLGQKGENGIECHAFNQQL